MSRAAFTLVALFFLSTSMAQATAYLISGITITTTQVKTYHRTYLDYTTAADYNVGVDAWTLRNGSDINDDWATDGIDSSFWLYSSRQNNYLFEAKTDHWLQIFWSYQVGSTIWYEDYAGFSLLSTGTHGGSETISNPGTYTTVQDDAWVYLGTTKIGDNTYPPVISGINVIGSQVRGESGYIEVYGTNLSKYASPSYSSVSAVGVSTNVVWQDYTYPNQVNLSYSISSGATSGPRGLTVTTAFGTSNSATFNVYDPSPEITGIPHNYWGAGGRTYIEIYGQGFGAQPEAHVTGSGVTDYDQFYESDNQINIWVEISPTASNATGTVTVTASNVIGGMFQQEPGGGGAQDAATASILSKSSFSMDLDIVDFEVDADQTYEQNDYSEDTTIQVTAVRNSNGDILYGWTGTVPILEDGTTIYFENNGSLPSTVTIPYGDGGATTSFVASSLAGGQATFTPPYIGPPADAEITTDNGDSSGFSVYQVSSLGVPQWRKSSGTIDSNVCAPNQVYDWFQYKMQDIWDKYPSGNARTMLNEVSCYQVGALDPGTHATTNLASSVVTFTPFTSMARLKSGISMCGESINGLVNITLHEARHAYQGNMAAGYDGDGDYLVSSTSAYSVYPNATVLDSTTEREVCREGSLVEDWSYKGDASPDSLHAPDWAAAALDHDAAEFALIYE